MNDRLIQDIISNNKTMFVLSYNLYNQQAVDFIKQVSEDELKQLLDDELDITECEVNQEYFVIQPADVPTSVQNQQMCEWFAKHNVTKMYHAETDDDVLDVYIVD